MATTEGTENSVEEAFNTPIQQAGVSGRKRASTIPAAIISGQTDQKHQRRRKNQSTILLPCSVK